MAAVLKVKNGFYSLQGPSQRIARFLSKVPARRGRGRFLSETGRAARPCLRVSRRSAKYCAFRAASALNHCAL